jgi:3-hydroxyacyl-CoA dehydrogenase
VAAQTGHQVTIVEVNEDAIKKAKNGIENSLHRVAKKLYKVYTYCNVCVCVYNCTRRV